MSCPVEYWIWLQRTLGPGFFADEILTYFKSPREMYEAGKTEWLRSGLLTSKAISRLVKYSPSQSYDVMSACEKNDWIIVPQDSEYYPEKLKYIYASPLVLYVWGDPTVLREEVAVGMVGTRECSDYGHDVAYSIATDLTKAGCLVVSGGALGVDRAVHEAALNADGKTIAFLGCGLGYDYLRANGDLRKRIAHNGAVVSEFMPYFPPSKRTFPIRNRLISGMTLGTVVTEAGDRSGSLITARYAFEQGRDVFAVPGDVTSLNFFGTNKLIRDGAKPVFSSLDILYEYADMFPEKINTDGIDGKIRRRNAVTDVKKEIKQKNSVKKGEKQSFEIENNNDTNTIISEAVVRKTLPDYASENAVKLYGFLTNEAQIVDIIANNSEMEISDVLASLTELEMYGCVTLHSGDRYSL